MEGTDLDAVKRLYSEIDLLFQKETNSHCLNLLQDMLSDLKSVIRELEEKE